MKMMHYRLTLLAAIAVVLTGAVPVSAQTYSFENELTTDAIGWFRVGTTYEHWVTTTPPALPYLAFDNIRGTVVGSYTRSLPKRFEGKHPWAATINHFNLRAGVNYTYQTIVIGAIETNGWVNSDFAGVRINDNNGAARNGYAYLRDGASAWAGGAVSLATATNYKISIGYTNKTVHVTFSTNNIAVGTSTVTATGSPNFSWGNFGFANGVGGNGYSDGFHVGSTRDISFEGYIPPPGTLVTIR